MSRRLDMLTGLLVLATLVIASPVRAAGGAVSMSWDACTPIVQNKSSATPGPYSIYVSQLGNDMVTLGYQVRVLYADPNQTVPDAWRFDAAGCQGSAHVALDHLAPASVEKACPSMQQAGPSLGQIKIVEFSPVFDPYPTTAMRIVLANSYLYNGVQADGNTRYFLARFTFDHTYSASGPGTPGSTCGGFESPVCFIVTSASFITGTPNYPLELPFDRVAGETVVTFNGGIPCLTTPARATTWGAIRGQYRN